MAMPCLCDCLPKQRSNTACTAPAKGCTGSKYSRHIRRKRQKDLAGIACTCHYKVKSLHISVEVSVFALPGYTTSHPATVLRIHAIITSQSNSWYLLIQYIPSISHTVVSTTWKVKCAMHFLLKNMPENHRLQIENARQQSFPDTVA